MTTMATRLPKKHAETTAELTKALNPAFLALPFPPSINALWRAVAGRNIMSKTYRDWIAEAGLQVVLQKPKKTLGKVGITVRLRAPDKRRRDLDNVGFKAIIDLLVKHGLIEGDDSRFVRSIYAEWVPDEAQWEKPGCTVTIKPAVF